jgi:hypothetical protein
MWAKFCSFGGTVKNLNQNEAFVESLGWTNFIKLRERVNNLFDGKSTLNFRQKF